MPPNVSCVWWGQMYSSMDLSIDKFRSSHAVCRVAGWKEWVSSMSLEGLPAISTLSAVFLASMGGARSLCCAPILWCFCLEASQSWTEFHKVSARKTLLQIVSRVLCFIPPTDNWAMSKSKGNKEFNHWRLELSQTGTYPPPFSFSFHSDHKPVPPTSRESVLPSVWWPADQSSADAPSTELYWSASCFLLQSPW